MYMILGDIGHALIPIVIRSQAIFLFPKFAEAIVRTRDDSNKTSSGRFNATFI